MDAKVFTVKTRADTYPPTLFALHYYSGTWDIIDFQGGDDDCDAVIVASFAALTDAQTYAREHGAYMLIRPPSSVTDAGIAWLRFVSEASTSDGATMRPYQALR